MKRTELAKVKIERAIALCNDYDSLDEEKLKQALLCLQNGLSVLPVKSIERQQLFSLVNKLISMDIQRYGYVFKASSWKNTMMINQTDLTELVWRAHSLL